ncbi:hypothetical protein KC333_g8908 [Hortaea werneckii]|nr:hypothetical protein KC361_g9388 [Hortaea werneckii]KAI6826034.1 hypothetical protein KC342_g10721 [Hortaea werneckii]KAI6854501.1 hypothetical protein KC323_g8783 [Hortaea werneckii]KAI6855732.1 hypothetical protein KC338_g8735 [Hortaea werneckii]KAI7092594.1 hypothetical protein KC339_g12347 [Hortaea werneckii]
MQQEWSANVRAREAEKKKQEEEKKNQHGDKDDKSQGRSNDQQQQNQQQNQQQDHHKDDEQGEQQEDNRSEEENLRDKYTPQEPAFLRALEPEKNYLASLKGNDSTGHSNVQNWTTMSIDEADQFTPDNWIPRSLELIRLSGKHPLNAEVPIIRLFECGFITPNELR